MATSWGQSIEPPTTACSSVWGTSLWGGLGVSQAKLCALRPQDLLGLTVGEGLPLPRGWYQTTAPSPLLGPFLWALVLLSAWSLVTPQRHLFQAAPGWAGPGP